MAYMRGGPIAGQQWDTVLVDEVTMVPPAICLYLSSLAGGRLLFAGDPRQLGPIYESKKQVDDSDQRWNPSEIFMSCAVIRSFSSDFLTLPSRI